MKNAKKVQLYKSVIDYYTIFEFFLQIVIDFSEKMLIMNNVERKTLQADLTKNRYGLSQPLRGGVFMKKVKIMLDSIAAVKKFVSIVSMYDFDVDLASGRYAVDAKSIMGIFSLDLSNPIQLVAHTDSADKFIDEIKEFIVD